jgi:uncharacterized coiled-coil DUF342 family protein
MEQVSAPPVAGKMNGPEAPPVILPPMVDYGSDVVSPPPELGLPTRIFVIEQLIQKHASMVERFTHEREGLEVPGQVPMEESDEERARRDEINRVVQTLKAERGSLKEKNKLLSKELFALLERQERLKVRSKDISVLQGHISTLEWKIETEDITIEQERKHIDEIKRTMRELRSMTDGLTPDELTDRTVQIQEEIDQNLLRMEEAHNAMLEKVVESNLHHGRFVDAQKKARELEARRQWLTRRVELHSEMGKFWEGQLENARKLDEEDRLRPVGAIRDALLARMEERPAGKPEEGAKDPMGEQRSVPANLHGKPLPHEGGQQGQRPRGRPRKKVGPSRPEVSEASDRKDRTPEVAVEALPVEGSAESEESVATQTGEGQDGAIAHEGGGA